MFQDKTSIDFFLDLYGSFPSHKSEIETILHGKELLVSSCFLNRFFLITRRYGCMKRILTFGLCFKRS